MNIGKINTSTLKITDMCFADIDGGLKRWETSTKEWDKEWANDRRWS